MVNYIYSWNYYSFVTQPNTAICVWGNHVYKDTRTHMWQRKLGMCVNRVLSLSQVRIHDVQNIYKTWMACQLYFISHSLYTWRTKRSQNLNGLSIIIWNTHKTWMACQLYFAFSQSVHAMHETFTKVEWLVNCISSFLQSVYATYETFTDYRPVWGSKLSHNNH